MFRFTVLKVPISLIGRSSNLIDLLEYSLESFKVFHCSVIKVLCFVVVPHLAVSLIILPWCKSVVNTFLHLFQKLSVLKFTVFRFALTFVFALFSKNLFESFKVISLFNYQGSRPELFSLAVSSIIISHLWFLVNKFFQLFRLFSIESGEGGIWTLAPLLTTCTLSRGVPSASLGTSPNQITVLNYLAYHTEINRDIN